MYKNVKQLQFVQYFKQVAFSSRETIFSQKKALSKLQNRCFGEQNRAQIGPSSLKIAFESQDRHKSSKIGLREPLGWGGKGRRVVEWWPTCG